MGRLIRNLGGYLVTSAKLKEKVLKVFEKLISAAEKTGNAAIRADLFSRIAHDLIRVGYGDMGVKVFEKAISAMEKIEDDWHRAGVFISNTTSLLTIAGAEFGGQAAYMFKDRIFNKGQAVRVLKKLISAAEKIGNPVARADVFKTFADVFAQVGSSSDKEQICAALICARLSLSAGARSSNDKAAAEMFGKSISAAEMIGDAEAQAKAFRNIASSLARAGLKEKAGEMFEKS